MTLTPSPPPQQQTPNPPRRVLIVGNYCHDVLIQNGTVVAETLGGAASFISNVLDSSSVSCHLISKVGRDFKYHHDVAHPPIVAPAKETTVFEAYFDLGIGHSDRVLKRVAACDPILPSDIPDSRYAIGMAVGVGGEILPETLEKMVEICDVVAVDIQALIRVFDPVDGGAVKLVDLRESGFQHLMDRIGFLKASSDEALFMDVEEMRRLCCVVVTSGEKGCRIYDKDDETVVPPFLAKQVDPTGAGDSFLGGLVVGLVEGLDVPDAALLGNLFGSVTVEHIGQPKFDLTMLQRVKDEVQRRKKQCNLSSSHNNDHDEFHARLSPARFQDSPLQPKLLVNGHLCDDRS